MIDTILNVLVSAADRLHAFRLAARLASISHEREMARVRERLARDPGPTSGPIISRRQPWGLAVN